MGFAKISQDATIENNILRQAGDVTELKDLNSHNGIHIQKGFSRIESVA